MWDEASAYDVARVEDLTDEQFLRCLREVDKYYRMKLQHRESWGLEPRCGPQCLRASP